MLAYFAFGLILWTVIGSEGEWAQRTLCRKTKIWIFKFEKDKTETSFKEGLIIITACSEM